jgi:predicted RNase H-like HicB family nuclease
VPDLPGCVANGATLSAVESEIRDAIRFHIEGLKAGGLAVLPRPASRNMSRRDSGWQQVGKAKRERHVGMV